MNPKVEKAFNEQINHELHSAYIYLAMAAFFDAKNLEGMANWMRVQVKEEYEHAMKFYAHINDRGGRVALQAVAQPKGEWGSPLDAWKDAYKHEQFITSKIHDLVKLSRDEKDYAAENFLAWFVNEQVEEEVNTSKVVDTLEMIGPSGSGLVMLDKTLGKREE